MEGSRVAGHAWCAGLLDTTHQSQNKPRLHARYTNHNQHLSTGKIQEPSRREENAGAQHEGQEGAPHLHKLLTRHRWAQELGKVGKLMPLELLMEFDDELQVLGAEAWHHAGLG